MTAPQRHPAVFLDRDGTLIREVNYLFRPEQVEILDGVPAALRALRAGGFKTVVVTNQSAVARGWLTEAVLDDIHRLMLGRLAEQGATLDGIYYCPHHPSEGLDGYRVACDCRKPNPGMIQRAARELGLDPRYSYVVGDQSVDHELALRVGAVPVIVRSNGEKSLVDDVSNAEVFANLKLAADWILAQKPIQFERAGQ